MRRKINYRGKCFLAICLSSTLLFAILITWFLYAFNRDFEKSIGTFLSENTKANEQRYQAYLQEKISLLQSIGVVFEESDRLLHDPKLVDYLVKACSKSGFIRMSIITENGSLYTSEYQAYDFFDHNVFQKAIQGEIVISGLFHSVVDQEPSMLIAVPIKRDTGIVGVLTGTLMQQQISEELNLIAGCKECKIAILNSVGAVYAYPKDGENWNSIFDYITIEENADVVSKIQKDLLSKQDSVVSFYVKGQKMIAYYCPISDGENFLINILPKNAVLGITSEAISDIVVFLSLLAGLLLLTTLGGYVVFSSRLPKFKKMKDPLL